MLSVDKHSMTRMICLFGALLCAAVCSAQETQDGPPGCLKLRKLFAQRVYLINQCTDINKNMHEFDGVQVFGLVNNAPATVVVRNVTQWQGAKANNLWNLTFTDMPTDTSLIVSGIAGTSGYTSRILSEACILEFSTLDPLGFLVVSVVEA